MTVNVLLIKNNIKYPLEAIVGLTDLHLKDTLNLDDFIDLLEFDASEFDVVLFEIESWDTFEKATLDRISTKWNKPALIITPARNEENLKRVIDNYLLVEHLTPLLLEKSVLLAIEKKKVDDLNWKLQNYEQLIEEDAEEEANLTIGESSYLEDDILDLNQDNEFFNQYDSTESELKWLGILLNAVPCGIII